MSGGQLFRSFSAPVLDSLFTLKDDLDQTKRAQFQLSGITSGQTRVLTLPDGSTILVGRDTTDVLTNKELTNQFITGNSGPPSTPAASKSKLYGRGTSNLSLGFMNEGGVDQTIITNGGTAGAIKSLVAQRQGGTTGDATWSTAGTSNTDTSAKPVLIQTGSATSNGGAGVAVTFPTSYTQIPLIFVQAMGTGNGFWAMVDTTGLSITGFTLTAWSATGTLVVKTVQWLAIGQ